MGEQTGTSTTKIVLIVLGVLLLLGVGTCGACALAVGSAASSVSKQAMEAERSPSITKEDEPSGSAQDATLSLSSQPPGAIVKIDNDVLGKVTPLEMGLSPGQYRVSLSLPGYKTETLDLRLVAGDVMKKEVQLSELEAGPKADYYSAEEVAAAGNKAVGKTALIAMGRSGSVHHETGGGFPGRESYVNGFACDGSKAYFFLHFTPAQGRQILALPRDREAQECPRVFLKIKRTTGTEDPWIRTEVTKILDVEPLPELKKAGVDFATFDELTLAGKAAVNKVVELPMWRDPAKAGTRSFEARLCFEETFSPPTFKLSFQPAQVALVQQVLEGGRGEGPCRLVRLKLTSTGDSISNWVGQLLEVGDQVDGK